MDVQDYHRPLGLLSFFTLHPVASLDRFQSILQCFFCHPLPVFFDSSLDCKATPIQQVFPQDFLQLWTNKGDEVRRHGPGTGSGCQAQGLFDCLLILFLGDVSCIEQVSQNEGPAGNSSVLIDQRGVIGWSSGQASNEGTLCQAQLPDVLVEIPIGRGLHSIGSATQIYLVQVEGEDFILAIASLNLQGQ